MRTKKSLGQHFLVDKNIAQKMVREAEIGPEDYVVEIGCGKGILTREILARCKKLVAYEIDPDLFAYIKHTIQSNKFKVIKADFLEDELDSLRGHSPWKVVANIPYNITSPLIFKLFAERELFSTITMMMQKEVADRIAAAAGSKTYGRISVKTQLYYKVKKLFQVPPHLFSPQPQVHSAVIQLKPKKSIPIIDNSDLMERIIDKSFQQRRKMLRTSLKSLFSRGEYERINTVDFDLTRRPEELDEKEFIDLSNKIDKKL